MKNKLGVIGGMGSEATSYFFEEVVAHTKADKDQDHIDTIILNHATLPDRTDAILSGDAKELVDLLIADAKLLETIGVKNIAIPCNTSHYFYEAVQSKINIPIIHMIRETVQYAVNQFQGAQKIGLMATTGTVQSNVYHKEIERLGLEVVTPSPDRQADVMSLIYEDIKSGQAGDYNKFQRTYDELIAAGSDVIILACTELSVFKKKNQIYDNCLDALDVLVKESIIRSNATYQ
jgi:aspartate racemase